MKDCYYSRYEPIFGSWYITEEIGSGAEGFLFRIRREDSLGHEYFSALKAIRVPAGGESEIESMMAGGMSREDAERYIDEALSETTQEFELLEKLKGNSYIASYEDHDVFKREDDYGWDILIRMEELTPLVKYSIDNPLSEEDVLKMGIDICRGLVVCRKFEIIHRDIKPENIFISPNGDYKLGDFGIARIVENTTISLSRKGTYSYMAPEVYWGQEYGPTVDLYSLGMVMYRYLNDGRAPFMPVYPEPVKFRDGEEAFLKRIGGREIPAPRKGSEELKKIVLKACAYDRKDRFSDAGEMLNALERLSAGEPVKYSLINKLGRKKVKIAAAVTLALLIVLAGCYLAIPKAVEDIAGPENGTAIYYGEQLKPEYKVLPEWFKDEPVTFSSSDESVFTVGEDGTIDAVSVGDATLTMSAKDYSEEVTLSVIPKVTMIDEVDDNINMVTGDELKLKPVLKPEKFSSEPVGYRSSDKGVVKVNKKGKLTAVAAGEAVVTLESGGSSFSTKIQVTDPVIYSPPASSSSSSRKSSSGSGKSSGKKKSSSGKSNKGYFDSSDDEHF